MDNIEPEFTQEQVEQRAKENSEFAKGKIIQDVEIKKEYGIELD